MYHAARPQIAATPAARKSGRLAARVARDDRGEAKLGSASGWDLPPERPALDPLDLPDVGDDSALIADPAEARAIFGGGLLDLRPDSAATVAALPQQCWRWLKTDHLCWFKTDQGWRPRGTPLGCG